MARFRELTRDDVVQILSAFGFASAAYVGHQPIAAGTINTNVRVETTDGPRFLRINEGKTADDVAREAAIVAHLAKAGVPTPVPLTATTGAAFASWGGQFVSMFPWLRGRTLARAELHPDHARQVGRALAILHRAGATFPDHRPGRYEPDEIDRRLAHIAALAPSDPALERAVAILKPELAALHRARAAALPLGLIHGDLFVDNVLFDGPTMTALLDFEQASWGRLAYDVAVTALAFGFGRDDFRADVVRALFEGYGAERPMTPDERAGFAEELRFAACRFSVTRITDVYLKRSGAAPGKDFHRYLARLESVRRHAGSDQMLRPL
jgi:homoserine kinase type II